MAVSATGGVLACSCMRCLLVSRDFSLVICCSQEVCSDQDVGQAFSLFGPPSCERLYGCGIFWKNVELNDVLNRFCSKERL